MELDYELSEITFMHSQKNDKNFRFIKKIKPLILLNSSKLQVNELNRLKIKRQQIFKNHKYLN